MHSFVDLDDTRIPPSDPTIVSRSLLARAQTRLIKLLGILATSVTLLTIDGYCRDRCDPFE